MHRHSRATLGALLFFPAWVIAAASSGCAQAMDDNATPGNPVDLDASAPPSASDASACRPGDVQTYEPGGYHSATASGQGVCDAAAVQGFDDACLGPRATHETCMAFKADPATAACARCIDTPDTETRYGPLVDHGTFITPNVAGCIELTAPSRLQCARSLQALSGCELAACEANCPVQDAASRAAYDACAAQADTGGCHSFQAVVAACVSQGGGAGPADLCLAANFADFYAEVVPLFCSAPQTGRDAGLPSFDASFDGPPLRDAGA
ncbi:MAG: hypothetical protein JOZ69_11990, partial [Myxococcales bacterium]|nr:hypothetical protein [Myxococcales bacterium]